MPRRKISNSETEPLSNFQNLDKTGREDIIDPDLQEEEKPFVIMEAQIKDDFCNYSYEVIKGVGLGFTHNVKGKGIIEDDMRNAFAAFNVHLACLDDVFKHSGVEIVDIDRMKNHELTGLYHVTGFKIRGSKEDESIILIGNKYVAAAGGRFELESPKIPLDNLSSYKWYNELKAAADHARMEVALYAEGKYTLPEVEEVEPKLKQTKIKFAKDATHDGEELEPVEESMDEFDSARV